jgi:hypothetical protein
VSGRSNDRYGCAGAFSRPRLSSRSCAAVNAEPQVPHLQFVNELATALDPSWVVGVWFPRIARTNSPPQSEHFRFCIFGP